MSITSLATLPRSIYIEPTSRCNELCQQCPRTLLSREDDRDLSFENFRFIVDQFPVLDRVVLHGLGEPLLNKDLPRMISYLKARGTYVLFNSNGILLNARRGQALIRTAYARSTCSASSTSSKEWPTRNRPCSAVPHAKNSHWCVVANRGVKSVASPLLLLAPPHPWRAWYGQIFCGMAIVPGLVVSAPTP